MRYAQSLIDSMINWAFWGVLILIAACIVLCIVVLLTMIIINGLTKVILSLQQRVLFLLCWLLLLAKYRSESVHEQTQPVEKKRRRRLTSMEIEDITKILRSRNTIPHA